MSNEILNLKKNSVLSLKKVNPIAQDFKIGIKWTGGVDFDLSALAFVNDILYSKNVVFYGQLQTTGITHSGDDRIGVDKKGYNELITIKPIVKEKYNKIIFLLTIDDETGKDKFGATNLSLDIIVDNDVKVQMQVSDSNPDAISMVLAQIDIKNGEMSYTNLSKADNEKTLEDYLVGYGIPCSRD